MAGERILIVDEQPKIARRMARALLQEEDADFQVDVCTTSDQALERLAEAHVHLVVADMRIPGISGLELLEEVRQRSPQTRCVLTTGFSSPALQERAHKLKVDAYLVKPFTMPEFVRVVQEALPPPPAPEPDEISNAAYAEAVAKVQARIEMLVRDVGAMGALVLDPSGQLLTECGQRGDFDANSFLALVGNTMAAANAVSHMLGDQDALDLHFHEGKNYSIYTARINDSVFLSLILPQSTGSRIGLVWLALRRTIADLRVLVADVAFSAPAPISNDFIDALDDALDIALGPSGGVGPAESSDPPAGPAPSKPQPPAAKPRNHVASNHTAPNHVPPIPQAHEPVAPDPMPFDLSDQPDPLAALMASGELETVDLSTSLPQFERDDGYDPLAGLVPEPKANAERIDKAPPMPTEPLDVLDLSAAFGPLAPKTPAAPDGGRPPAPTEVAGTQLTFEPASPAPELPKAPPKSIPENMDFDKLFDFDNIDDTPPAPPPPVEERKLSYEEAKRLGLIKF